MPRAHPGLGLIPDSPDRRDRALYRAVPDIAAQPERADCSALLPPPMDQSAVGACVGYSCASLFHAVMRRDGHRRPFVPSPVFLYREARVLGGYVEEDCGSEIRNAFKAANRLGLPPMSNLKPRFNEGDLADESGIFPERSIWRRQPPPSAYADGERRQLVSYFKLETLPDLLQCLAEGWPAVLGFLVFRSLYGWGGPRFDVPDPQPGDRELGGHAVCAYGYDRATQRVLFRNSWGQEAHEGRPDFTLSFAYLERYSWDCWTARRAEGFDPSAA